MTNPSSIERAWTEVADSYPKAGRKNKGVARRAKEIRREEAIERQRWLLNIGVMVWCRHGTVDPDSGLQLKVPAQLTRFGHRG